MCIQVEGVELGGVGEEGVGQGREGMCIQVEGVELGGVGEEGVGQGRQTFGFYGQGLQARRAGQEMIRPQDAGATGALQIQTFQAGQARQAPPRGGVRVRHDDLRRPQARQAGQVVGFPQPQAVIRNWRQGRQRRQIGPGRIGAGARPALRGQGGQQRGADVGAARADRGRPCPRQGVAARADVGQVRVDPERARAAPGIGDGQPGVVRAATLHGQNRLRPRLPADRVRQARPGAQVDDRSRYLHRDGGRRAERRRGPAAEAARPQRRERECQAGEAQGQANGRRRHGERNQGRQAILAQRTPAAHALDAS